MRKDFYAELFELEDRHWWFRGRREILLRVLDNELPQSQSGQRRILDVGCGTGALTQRLAAYGEVQGLDADPEAIRFCRLRGMENVQQASGPFPFEDGEFDLVTALDVLEHVPDDRGMLDEIRRVLAPGGHFLGTVPAYRFLWGPHDEVAQHQRRYVAPELRSRVEQAGLKVRRLTYFNTLLFPPIAAVRLLRRLRPGAGEARSDCHLGRTGALNGFLRRVFALEAPLVRRVKLPFGVSILVLASKPEALDPGSAAT
jgi:SAM-dependent methyltransferase